MRDRWSRRDMLRRGAALGVMTTIPAGVLAQAARSEPYANLTATEAATLEAVVARLIPSDASGPGALEAGAARYIDRALGDALAAQRPTYVAGLAALAAYARSAAGGWRSRSGKVDAGSRDAAPAVMRRSRAAAAACRARSGCRAGSGAWPRRAA